MPYCMYLRKSRADAEAEARCPGDTLLRHEQALTELAARLTLPIEAVYRELVSGESIDARPVMRRLLSEVERGCWEGVLVMEVERLARGDTVDQGVVARAFKYAGAKIVTPLKTFDPSDEFDEEYFEFGLFMSRREYKVINRRLQRGRLASVREGKFVGSRAPFGYRRIRREGKNGFILEPDPQEADAVRLVFGWFAGEISDGGGVRPGLREIARRLDALGISSPGGCVWSPAAIGCMLRNPVYAGWIRWNFRKTVKSPADGSIKASRPRSRPENWILVRGLHNPLISPGLFEKTRLLLQSRPIKPGPVSRSKKNPLSGLLYCALCGRAMIRRPGKSGSPDSLFCPSPGCPTVGGYLSAAEDCLLAALEYWYILPHPLSPARAGSVPDSSRLIRRRLDTVVRQKDSLCGLLERGVYDEETFLRRRETLETKETELLVLLRDTLRVPDAPLPDLSSPVSMAALYRAAPSPEEKNRLLRSLLEKAEYRKEGRLRFNGGRETLVLPLYPRLPPAMLSANPAVRKNWDTWR
ncbi:recombinase family protein [Papillibacter cinnamivorans]|uniref:Site-specific DNA recombinase n=1 Tax=Papillibacter cinnamivorans DSM 12816 TaxID=1122930 RepID=A0A1W1ZQF2_9FIRM|nr:recombinase family protein [Papillibacter cinnamivorans]SMC50624.1 Site-specific DNA recombinase [Papillibacter cinnamivorans DSM 12816]